jgi:hypothetical protein
MSDTFDLGGAEATPSPGGPPSATQPGAYVQGTVLDMKEVQKTNVEGGRRQARVLGQRRPQDAVPGHPADRAARPRNPADDGKRDVYLDGRRRPNDDGTKSKLCAVLDAVREATGGTQLQRGGKLTLQWTSGMGFSGDPRCFAAWYEAPALNLGAQPPGVAARRRPGAPPPRSHRRRPSSRPSPPRARRRPSPSPGRGPLRRPSL